MKRNNLVPLFIIFGLGLVLGGVLMDMPPFASAQGPVDTAFTYQGRLLKQGGAVGGPCNFQFSLYNAPTGGSQLGSTLPKPGVAVIDGYFTVSLNFGNVFDGNKRYLQIAVQCPPDPGYTPLSGRVELNPAPYALYAKSVNWANVTGKPEGFADNQDDSGLGNCTPDRVLQWRNGGWVCGDIYNSEDFVRTNGGVLEGHLDAKGKEIRNLPTAEVPGNPLTFGQPAGGDLGGTYPNPAVVALQGRPIATATPSLHEVLTWDGSHWGPAPSTPKDSIGMEELNIPMGSGTSNEWMEFPGGNSNVDTFVATVEPTTPGHCLVVTSAQIRDIEGGSFNAGATLSSIKKTDNEITAPAEKKWRLFEFGAGGDGDHDRPTITTSYIWEVEAGKKTEFGCRIYRSKEDDPDWDSDIDTDEEWICQISYICQ